MMSIAQIEETVGKLHAFTTHADGIRCSCGEEVTDIAGSWKHTLDMRAAAASAENESAAEGIRATPAKSVKPVTAVQASVLGHFANPTTATFTVMRMMGGRTYAGARRTLVTLGHLTETDVFPYYVITESGTAALAAWTEKENAR